MPLLEFEPASGRQVRPKILLFGDKGTKKTITTLGLSEVTGARTAVIDTEHGTDTYGDSFVFDVIHTDDPIEVEGQVDRLLADPGDYTLLGIDPLSQVYDRVVDMADTEIRALKSRGPKTVATFEVVLDPGVYRRIGQLQKILYRKIRLLDMAVVVTAHEAVEYRSGKSRTGGLVLEKVGTKAEGHKSIGYWFDLVLNLEKFGDNVVARVKKARGVPLKVGDTIEEFSAEKLAALFPEGAFTRRATAHPVVTEEQAEEIHALIDRAGLLPADVNKALTRYGASCVELLPRDAAEGIIENLKSRPMRQG